MYNINSKKGCPPVGISVVQYKYRVMDVPIKFEFNDILLSLYTKNDSERRRPVSPTFIYYEKYFIIHLFYVAIRCETLQSSCSYLIILIIIMV